MERTQLLSMDELLRGDPKEINQKQGSAVPQKNSGMD